MKTIIYLFRIILFLRKASQNGILLIASKSLGLFWLRIISFILAPLSSLLFTLGVKNLDLSSALERMGPIFIKFGQLLSSRSDLVGTEIAIMLQKLQDRLIAFPREIAVKTIESELNAKISDIFDDFPEDPVASASIAQVYKARLKNGDIVAVKILRPDVAKKYQNDIRILYDIARIAKLFISRLKNIKLIEAVHIFEKSMKFELDLKNEAASCSSLAQYLANDQDVVIPRVYWEFSTSKLVTLEWIDGISIYDTKSIEENLFSKAEILRKLAVSFFNQAFRDGFFHADLHPGNILITHNGKIAFLDFGIMGFLSEKDRLGLAELLYCLLHKDYYRVAEIHKEIGFVPQNVNMHEFALACRAVAEPIVGQPASKLSVGSLIENLIKMTAEFGMQTQPQLLLLQKNIVILEGLGQILAPEVNMWNLAEPWITKWATKNLGFDAKILRICKSLMTELKVKIQTANIH